MGTLTISVNDQTEEYFRKIVHERLGDTKGTLGKAANEAFQRWAEENDQKRIAQRAIDRMTRGYNLGKKLYKTRDDLHEH